MGAARQQLRASEASGSWVNGLAQLGDCLTKLGATARAPFEKYLRTGTWQCKYDDKFESAKKRKARGAGAHKSEESDDETEEMKTLMEDEGMGDDIRGLLRDKYT